jgi:hypothetical protein
MTEPPVPSVLAMLICDQIIVDQMSQKKSIIGVFDKVHSPNFPAGVNCAVYAKLADAEGAYAFKLIIVNLKDERLIGEIQAKGQVNSALESTELAVQFMGIQLPEEGKYEVQLWANDVYLSRITLSAVKLQLGVNPWPPQ